MLIAKQSDEDTVLLEIIHKNLKFFAASMYFDIEDQNENNLKKMDDIQRFVSGGRILIAADSNLRSKMWHDVKTNPRGRKMEEYLASKQLHIINEESDWFTFSNTRGSSNIDLTIANNNLIAAVSDWEISAEESLSDHIYLKYKIGEGGADRHNRDNTSQGTKYVLKIINYMNLTETSPRDAENGQQLKH
jgi:hypothetical protein